MLTIVDSPQPLTGSPKPMREKKDKQQQKEPKDQQKDKKDKEEKKSSVSSAVTTFSASAAAAATASGSNTLASQVFRLALFDHLPRKQAVRDPDLIEEDRVLHPATVNLGLLYQRGVIQSDDDRAHALISVLLVILEDYTTPPKKALREDLDKYIAKQIQHLVDCRPISKGMGSIIRYLRQVISKTPLELQEYEAKELILQQMRSFLEEKMLYASDLIAQFVGSTINDGDVLLTFGSSPLIRKILLHVAQVQKKSFQLVVVDTRPLCEGLQTLSALSQVVHCVYSPLSGIAVALQNVNKVVLGASCLLSNGSMLAPAGTAMVASMASAMQIPVLVASESYKFSDKVQLDPIVFNELGHTSEIAVVVSAAEAQALTGNDTPAGMEWVAVPQTENKYRGSADKSSLLNRSSAAEGAEEFLTIPRKSGIAASSTKLPYEVVNLRYDLTPLSNISVIATETGLIPPTSVPILLREIQSDLANK